MEWEWNRAWDGMGMESLSGWNGNGMGRWSHWSGPVPPNLLSKGRCNRLGPAPDCGRPQHHSSLWTAATSPCECQLAREGQVNLRSRC